LGSRYHCGEGAGACKFPVALQYLFRLPTCSYIDVVQKLSLFFIIFVVVDETISGKVLGDMSV